MSDYTGNYDDFKESAGHFRQIESDFDAILGGNMDDEEMVTDREWLQRMADAEDRAGSISVGGLAADTGQIRTFETGATRDTDEGKLDWEGFISPAAMEIFADYMHGHRKQSDGTLRDSDNWQKGMPRVQYMKSLIRHTWGLWSMWRRGDVHDLSELLCAIMFNCQGLLHEIAVGRDVGE